MHELFASYHEEIQTHWQHFLSAVIEDQPVLSQMLAHHFAASGKLLRPMLTVACYDLFCQDASPAEQSQIASRDATLQMAMAIECLHNATLVHDDLQDGDEMRRGHPTVWKAFGAYQAINVGSALYFYALRQVNRLEASTHTIQRLVQLMTEQSLGIIAGQALEKDLWEHLDLQDFAAARALYLEVVQKKTSMLFAMPMTSAAVLAQKSEAFVEQLIQMAAPLGALFQIQDDVLDLYGNKGRETPGNDLAEGKPSLLALHCLCHAEDADATRLLALLRAPREASDPEEIRWAIALIQRTGSLQASLEEIEALRAQALSRTQAHAEAPQTLTSLLDDVCTNLLRPIAHL